jgi:hypothetical protein
MRTLKRHPDSGVRRAAAVIEQTQPARASRTNRAQRRRTTRGPVFGTYSIPSYDGHTPPRSITAAAEVVFGKNVAKAKKRPPVASWQVESWELRREIPEFRFAGDRVGHGCSQYKMYIAKRPESSDGTPDRATDGPAAELSQMLFGDIAATQQALRTAGQHSAFNGESLIVINDTETGYAWKPYSVRQLTGSGRSWKLNDGIESRSLNMDKERVVRCWTPDPEFTGRADCAAQAVLPVARIIRGLGKRTAAEIDSRLAGAGVLMLPDDVQVMGGQGQADLVEALVESMLTPIQDPESAAALVPLILKMRAESIAKVEHLSFATKLDEKLPEMESNAIRRVALGMDSPPETLLGLGDSNHWSGWLLTSEEVQFVLSPTVATISHALWTGFAREMLAAMGEQNPDDYMVWFDASELELRPDKSTDSRDLHAKDVLSDEAMLRENGFSKEDMPDDAEKKRRFFEKLVLADPSLAPTIFPELGYDLDFTRWSGTAAPEKTPTEPAADPHPPGEHEPPVQPTDPPDDTIETGPGQ